MTNIDITKIEENVEQVLGNPKNILSNQFLIKNQYLCGHTLNLETLIYPHLIILVKSNSENFKERQSIRMTWAQKSRLSSKNINKFYFLRSTNPHNTSVIDESNKYEDIIQIDKIDYYYYSSYKMIMMLRWINDYCTSKSRRTSHIDLIYYYCELIKKSRPRRNSNDHYYVSLIDYPYDIYPDYISSQCFLMTRYNARLFYIESKYTRLFHFDNIYMGLLAYSMSIKLIKNNELFSTTLSSINIFNYQNQILSRRKTIFNNKINFNSTKKPICIRGYRNEKLVQLWNKLHQTNLTFSF
ncbi:unnamed protein product [Rotaria magnacalcarata]